jgi:eukaryotic-like serine/threonine-protein kinase
MSQAVRAGARDELPTGAYELLFQLGRGGMGTVHLARAIGAGGFERLIVIKRLHAHLLDQQQSVRRFLDEARVAARVHHSNVIGTHHVGNDKSGPFLVLDYVEGGNLEDLLARALDAGNLLPPPVLLRIALDALAGLEAIHTAQDAAGRPLNILHRDISLQNILVGRDGVARIADFGIAKSTLGSVSTDQAYVVGKLLYMPQEYLCRETPAPTLDVYSLGITLWLALSGRDLWPNAHEAALIKHIVEDEVPRLSTVMDIAPQIEAIVARAVHRDPKQRYPNAKAMSEDIETLSRQTGWVATHGDVATFVESLLGAELRQRRQLLAKYVAADEGFSDEELSGGSQRHQARASGVLRESNDVAAAVLERDLRIPVVPVERNARNVTTDLDIEAISIPGAPRSGRLIAVVAIVALAVALIGVLAWRKLAADGEHAEPAAAQKPPAAAPAATTTTTVASPPAPVVEPDLATSVPGRSTIRSTHRQAPKSRASGPKATGKPSSAPLPTTAPASEIGKNPYR